jgi:hAT family protein
VILDPRLKMDYYELNHWEPRYVAHAKDSLMQAIEAYGGMTEVAAVAMPQPSQASSFKDFRDELCEAWEQKTKRRYVEKGCDLERYLEKSRIDIHVDILGWWKHHQYEYPCLARIARDYLAIPATSASAERVFSAAADLITKKRGSLNDETIQACMCMHSWY